MKKILIYCNMHLGDMIMTSSILPVIKKAYPNAQIHYMTGSKETALVELFPHVDKIISYQYKSKGDYLSVYRWAKILKSEKYDLSITISIGKKKRPSIMTWLARIPIRMNLEQMWQKEVKKKKGKYTREAQNSIWDLTQHLFSESVFEIAKRTFGMHELKYSYPKLIDSSVEDSRTINKLLMNNNVNDSDFSVVFCVKTLSQNRNWAPKKFAELGDWLIEKRNAVVIFAGIPDDEETANIIYNNMKHCDRTVNLISKTSIKEAAALFRKVKLLISLDTGMGHLAAAAGCKVISIFGSANSKECAPAGEKVIVVASPQRTIETVTVQMVQDAVIKLESI